MQKGDIQSSSKVEYYEKLAKLYYYLCKCCESEAGDYANRGMAIAPAWRDDGMGGIGMENASMHRMSYGNAIPYSGASYGGTREQISQLMADPAIPYEAKEHLRIAMEKVR